MNENSLKRNRKIELSKEAVALKKMREFKSKSVRDVGDLLKISFTTVSHMENGRAVIHDGYLDNFLTALEFTREDFNCFVRGKFVDSSLRLKCLRLVEEIEPSKLEKLYTILSVI